MQHDWANTMMVCNSSVKTKIEAAKQSIFVMRCTCHLAHIAASYACSTFSYQRKQRNLSGRSLHTSATVLSAYQCFNNFSISQRPNCTSFCDHPRLDRSLFINALVTLLNNGKRLLNSSSTKQQMKHSYKLGKFMAIRNILTSSFFLFS